MRYIDLHTHVLSGVDDGADTMKTALKMLQMAAEHGTKALAVTPHRGDLTCADFWNRYAALCKAAAHCVQEIRLFPGMEIPADHRLRDLLMIGQAPTLGNSRFVLLELEAEDTELWCAAAIRLVRSCGFVPLIAHPERCRVLWTQPWRAELWCADGAYLQVTRGGVLGAFGEKVAETAAYLLQNRLAFCAASDGHGVIHRRPILDDLYAHLAKQYGERYAEQLLYENPRRVLFCET